MQVFKFSQGSSEWLHKRLENITATEISALFSMNPYQSAAAVARSKVKPESKFDSDSMRAGRWFEGGVFAMLRENGIEADQASPGTVVLIQHDTLKFSASLDGWVKTKKERYVVEAKTSETKFPEWESKPPLVYLLQVQAQLALTEWDAGILAFVGLARPWPKIVYEVQPNKIIHDIMFKEVARFWEWLTYGKPFVVNKEYKEIIKSEVFKNVEKIV